ncbi:MAG TPA: TfoX/Sxy family protein [Coriobacteriia bacterium]
MPDKPGPAMTPAQQTVDEVVAEWPEVRRKAVFGARGFVRGRSMFAFLTGEGVAVKAPTAAELDELYSRAEVSPFTYNGMPMRGWPVLPLGSDADTDGALSWVRRAYEAVG